MKTFKQIILMYNCDPERLYKIIFNKDPYWISPNPNRVLYCPHFEEFKSKGIGRVICELDDESDKRLNDFISM